MTTEDWNSISFLVCVSNLTLQTRAMGVFFSSSSVELIVFFPFLRSVVSYSAVSSSSSESAKYRIAFSSRIYERTPPNSIGID
jgi:hypothetical protein